MTTLGIPISKGGTNPQSAHYLALKKFEIWINIVIKFMNTCSFTIDFKKTNAYSKMFVE